MNFKPVLRAPSQKKSFFTLIVLVVGLMSGLILIQRVQEIREKALVGGPDLFFATSPFSVAPTSTGNGYDIYMNTNGFEVTATVLEVQFDINMIQITSISKGNALSDILVPGAVAGNIASITLGSGPSTPFNGTDKVATLTFDAKANNTQTDITFTQNTQIAAIGYPSDVLGTTSPGRVVIGSTATPTNSPSPTNAPTNSPTPTALSGDINGDGVVNILDFQILNNNFGTSNSNSDLNNDGTVNVLDFQIISNNFGKTAPPNETPTPTPPGPTPPPSGYYLEIDHEEGNLSEYDSFIRGDDLEITPSAALAGTTFGMSVDIDDTNSHFGLKEFTPLSTQTEFRKRYYLDPNSLNMASGESFWLVSLWSSTDSDSKQFENLRWDGSSFKLRSALEDDAPFGEDAVFTSFFDISDAPHVIEVHVTKATTSTSKDATLRFYIDGVLKDTLSGIDFYDDFEDLDTVLVGVNGVDSGTSGVLYFDEIVLRDDGNEIGP